MITVPLLKYLPPRHQVSFWSFVYSIRYGPLSNLLVALWFMRLAMRAFCGRIMLIDSARTTSNGGYKYYTVTISSKPVSAKYDESLYE